MKPILTIILFAFFMAPASACRTPWQACWFGQELNDGQCVGDIKIVSPYEAKLWLQHNPDWRLPSKQELLEFFFNNQSQALRQQALSAGYDAVLTAEVMQHGNELLAVSVNMSNGAVELQPWQQPLLIILRETSW